MTKLSKKFAVEFKDNKLVRRNRPPFISSTTKTLKVKKGEDRRHILHGATQITDVIINALNLVLSNYSKQKCEAIVDEGLNNFKTQGISYRMPKTASLIKKVEKLIAIAFSKQKNLVVGSATANQGIEKARSSIASIRNKLDEYCINLRSFNDIKDNTLELINSVLRGGSGEIAKYRLRILNLLYNTVDQTIDVIGINSALYDFQFSCTLDIVHENTTKAQNIWGLTMANKLQRACS